VRKPTLMQRLRAAFTAFGGKPALPPGAVPFGRMYAAARPARTTGGLGSSGDTSADAEIYSSLTRLRAASRQMIRDSSYAKRARLVVINNVIGAGVGMQAQTKTTRKDDSGAAKLHKAVNDGIEAAWFDWSAAKNCHTGGALHFHDLERAAAGEVFEAGEVFIRKHYSRFGESRVPLGLELIESERVPHEIVPPGAVTGNENRMGIECDRFGRAVAYWIRERHPGDVRGTAGATDRFERVLAEDIFHLRIVERWPQTRGVPWLHTVLRKLDEMNEYTGSEVSAARAASYYFATIESPDSETLRDEEEEDGQGVMNIDPLTIQQLNPGEKLTFHNPNRPNTALDPFMRHMLREVAAGCGVSYESLSRDYSQSNYSSSRLALLDDRDLWRMLQQWWIRNFRLPLHRAWLQQAVLGRAIDAIQPTQYATDASKFEAVLFKPRGWSWIDPTKEVEAYKEAIKAGLTTLTDVIAQTADGRDIEDVVDTRKREMDLLKQNGVAVDTDVAAEMEAKKPPPAAQQEEPDAEPARSRVVALKRDAG
jgi:lambda family phage portal protein